MARYVVVVLSLVMLAATVVLAGLRRARGRKDAERVALDPTAERPVCRSRSEDGCRRAEHHRRRRQADGGRFLLQRLGVEAQGELRRERPGGRAYRETRGRQRGRPSRW